MWLYTWAVWEWVWRDVGGGPGGWERLFDPFLMQHQNSRPHTLGMKALHLSSSPRASWTWAAQTATRWKRKAESFCIQLSPGEEGTGSSWSRAPIRLLANLCAEKKSCLGGCLWRKGGVGVVGATGEGCLGGLWGDREVQGTYYVKYIKRILIAGRLAGAISVGVNGQAPGGEVHSHQAADL